MAPILRIALLLALTLGSVTAFAANDVGPQTPVKPAPAAPRQYPLIVLYSVSWCPHCKAAKEYFTKNNIPFINRDVELDPAAMEALTGKYDSQGVPVIVIGNDEKVLKGFDQERFEQAVREVQKKK